MMLQACQRKSREASMTCLQTSKISGSPLEPLAACAKQHKMASWEACLKYQLLNQRQGSPLLRLGLNHQKQQEMLLRRASTEATEGINRSTIGVIGMAATGVAHSVKNVTMALNTRYACSTVHTCPVVAAQLEEDGTDIYPEIHSASAGLHLHRVSVNARSTVLPAGFMRVCFMA